MATVYNSGCVCQMYISSFRNRISSNSRDCTASNLQAVPEHGEIGVAEGRVWLFTVEHFLAISIKCVAVRRGIEKENSIAGW